MGGAGGKQVDIEEVSPEQLSDDADAVRDFEADLWLEQQPGEPESSVAWAVFLAAWRAASSTQRAWIARDGDGRIVGRAKITLPESSNQHIAITDVRVRRACRRRRIGSALARLAFDAARQAGRRELLFDTFEQVPDGERFLERLG